MTMLDNQSTYWDSVASEKVFSHPLCIDGIRRYIPASAMILDYGCGYGRTLAELSSFGYQNMVGLDYSRKMVARGTQEFPTLNLSVCDGQTIPFKNDHFDVVILFAVLTCIPRSEEQLRTVQEIYRVLRPGGVIYVSDYLLGLDERNNARYEAFVNKYQCFGVFELAEGVILRHHSSEWLEGLLAPFERLSFQEIEVRTMNSNPARAFQYFGRSLK